jgi:hypothetical protein
LPFPVAYPVPSDFTIERSAYENDKDSFEFTLIRPSDELTIVDVHPESILKVLVIPFRLLFGETVNAWCLESLTVHAYEFV